MIGDMDQRRAEIGITLDELEPGTAVMVAVGRGVMTTTVVAWAVVLCPVGTLTADNDPAARYWLDVYMIPGGPPLPQMYRADEILGVPALGLRMDGAPERDTSATEGRPDPTEGRPGPADLG